ncbi:MAG: hypothetical protein L0H31_00595 [Nocardioidaceae bacterium]|nr:hypothetical protein [Nocardioidaceae bacterium]
MTTRVTVAPEGLIVEPAGLDKLWSLTSRLEIPLEHVRGATHDPGMKSAPKGWRGPGLRLGDKLSGTFHADGDRQFWNVDGYDNVIVIELTHEHYQRLVISVEQPRELVEAIDAVAAG